MSAPRGVADNHPAPRHARVPLAPSPEPAGAIAARHRLHEISRRRGPELAHVAGVERQGAAVAVGGDDPVWGLARVGEGGACRGAVGGHSKRHPARRRARPSVRRPRQRLQRIQRLCSAPHWGACYPLHGRHALLGEEHQVVPSGVAVGGVGRAHRGAQALAAVHGELQRHLRLGVAAGVLHAVGRRGGARGLHPAGGVLR
mmetsp:Transcript_6979/g.17828  ORF Transcript_6979/g.17828 Transcript_6979/m.17828 type:complete len:201 (+) Transcript_6979:29-631(+)